MKKNGGFTIIELMVTLLIFAVTMVIVLGLGSGKISRTGLKSSANELIGIINKAKSSAAKENRAVAISFTANSYREHYYESGVWNPLLTSSSLPDGKIATGTSITGFSNIVFNSRGILIDETTFMIKASVKLTLNSDQGEGIKIKVLSYGGIKSKNSWKDSAQYGGF